MELRTNAGRGINVYLNANVICYRCLKKSYFIYSEKLQGAGRLSEPQSNKTLNFLLAETGDFSRCKRAKI